jgi:hypothetical protein
MRPLFFDVQGKDQALSARGAHPGGLRLVPSEWKAWFRQIGIYNPDGQKGPPVDKDQVKIAKKKKKKGQIPTRKALYPAGGMRLD